MEAVSARDKMWDFKLRYLVKYVQCRMGIKGVRGQSL